MIIFIENSKTRKKFGLWPAPAMAMNILNEYDGTTMEEAVQKRMRKRRENVFTRISSAVLFFYFICSTHLLFLRVEGKGSKVKRPPMTGLLRKSFCIVFIWCLFLFHAESIRVLR
ncbi:hypothetical protein CEXT_706921 [Caerostris extrusa]|uniref:Uncharacterized protein n=1 Tax=Caerostris extrusa TaxID=172846 RepID=A0AAV4PSC5_CAEEX|nr:hypothetical protein CEXT_706921 [Caerostris extrusa]